MKARTFLDGVEVANPNGIKELSQELFYDDELKGVFVRIDGDLEFNADGYDAISDALLNQGLCSQLEFLLQIGDDTLSDYFEGIIHIIDINRWNASREVIKTPISDNNLSSYIFNNQNVKAYVNAPKNKSGGINTAATIVDANFTYFTPSTGGYDYVRANTYTVDEVFSFLVRFCSDGAMTYSSPFFGSGGDKEGLCCASADHLATNSDTHPYLSFYELFTELDKIFNLSMRIDFSGTSPELIIDLTDNLYTSTSLYTFTNVKDLEVYFDRQRMYGIIDIGSETWQSYSNGVYNMPDARFLSFKDEKYYIIGQCNIDRSLNLINKFIIDSNVIEDMLLYANNSYDDTVVLVEADLATNRPVRYTNIIASSGYVYNLGLNNFNKAVNHLGAIPNDMVLFISNDSNNFEAEKNSAYSVTTAKIIHNTEISDPAGNYDPVLGRFTCPVGAEGSYSFTFSYTGLSYSGSLGSSAGSLTLRQYNSGGTLLNTITIAEFTHVIVVIDFGGASGAFNLEAGDYVELWGVAGLTSTTNFTSSTLIGNYIDVEGGTFQTYDPNEYKVFNIDFEVPLTQTQLLNIRDNITQKITVVSGSKTFSGWVKNLKRNILTGMSKFTLRSSNIDNQSRNISR